MIASSVSAFQTIEYFHRAYYFSMRKKRRIGQALSALEDALLEAGIDPAKVEEIIDQLEEDLEDLIDAEEEEGQDPSDGEGN